MEKEEMVANRKDDCPSNSNKSVRCAKAAMLLLSLGTCRDHQEKEVLRQTIDDLRLELVRERVVVKNLKLCNLTELALQILLLFCLCAFFLLLALKSP